MTGRRPLGRLASALTLAALLCLALLGAGSGGARPLPRTPRGFFGIVPQTPLTPRDIEYMRAGGIETIRIPISWAEVQPTPRPEYDWHGVDALVEAAARGGLGVLPFVASPPHWIGGPKTMPVHNARQRHAWTAFLEAAVRRYGPGGEFWAAHESEGIDYEPAIPQPQPIRSWQIWNEVNFFYFAYPVSPPTYAKLVKISGQAIHSVQPGAKVVLSGLFGEPTAKGKRGMPAVQYLRQLYRTPGIKRDFDAVALHPYAVDSESLEEMVEGIHRVTAANHDHPGLYITEMGWGSQNDFNRVAFEQGVGGQVRELRRSYAYLIANSHRLNLKGVYWFSWKDATGFCNFCDSVGLFRNSSGFHPKPAWRAFVSFTHGHPRP